MLLSYNWLKGYSNLPDSVTPEAVADKLKLSTVEVEGVVRTGASLDAMVVGKVVACEKHPNADKLQVCDVDVGNERLKIVCGGSNVAAGMLVAVARTGAKVQWHGAGELVELKPTTIRGVESNGMICASDEIGLGELYPKKDEKEILNLTALKIKPGTPLAAALHRDDAILEIDNKSLSNRPDLWGHYGMAREVAVLTNHTLKPYKTIPIKEGKELKISAVVADQKFCPKIQFVAVSGVKIEPSPQWLQQKLVAVGQRPINNIVDITNYVMFDIGKPLHAFDARALDTGKKGLHIEVRPAKPGEQLELLDGKKIALTPEYQVIANAERALSLAGIMGGKDSGVTADTTTVVFETAIFDAVNIRKTSGALGLRTDSSARFEKSLDPALCEPSLQKAVEMALALCPGARVASKICAVGKAATRITTLVMPLDSFEKKLGVTVPPKEVIKILERLGFAVTAKKAELLVKIPSWRATKDVAIAEDIVEEVARMYGYDKIPSVMPPHPGAVPAGNAQRAFERAMQEVLVRELHYTEVHNYSFVSAQQIAALGDKGEVYLELENPLSKEKPFVRRHLLHNVLENVQQNIENADALKLFEVGSVFLGEEAGPRVSEKSSELLPRQDDECTLVVTKKKNQEPFWDAKRALEALGAALQLPFVFAPTATKPAHPWMHPGRTAWVMLGEVVVGSVYELHPQVGSQLGLSERVGVCTLNISAVLPLLQQYQKPIVYRGLSPYPSVVRDVAFVVKKSVTHEQLHSALRNVDPLITAVVLFDVYSGSKLSPDHKSVAYHLTLTNNQKTLTTPEVDAVLAKVVALLTQKFHAELRA